jgi:hypothetical protein
VSGRGVEGGSIVVETLKIVFKVKKKKTLFLTKVLIKITNYALVAFYSTFLMTICRAYLNPPIANNIMKLFTRTQFFVKFVVSSPDK